MTKNYSYFSPEDKDYWTSWITTSKFFKMCGDHSKTDCPSPTAKVPRKYYHLTPQQLGKKKQHLRKLLADDKERSWKLEATLEKISGRMKKRKALISKIEKLQKRAKAVRCSCYRNLGKDKAECLYFRWFSSRKEMWEEDCANCKVKKPATKILARKLKTPVVGRK